MAELRVLALTDSVHAEWPRLAHAIGLPLVLYTEPSALESRVMVRCGADDFALPQDFDALTAWLRESAARLHAEADALDAADLAAAQRVAENDALPFPATIAELTRAATRQMIVLCSGNKTEAARRLGISRPRLHRILNASAEHESLKRRFTIP